MLSRIFASLFLFLSGVSISDFALSVGGDNNPIQSSISNIVLSGPQALLPTFRGEYILSWDGGQAPFTAILAEEPCPGGICGPGVTIFGQISGTNERQIAFDAFLQEPQIARLVGTIIDADGVAFTSAPLNVRVGTGSRFFIRAYDYVDFNADNGCSELRIFSPQSFDEFDPNEAFIRITDETAVGFPVFSWNSISNPSVVADDSIALAFEVSAGTFNPLFGLADEEGGEAGILSPLAYGDYSRPGTVPFDPFDLLPIPAPSLPIAESLAVNVTTLGGGCPTSRWFLGFALNPPEAGSPALLQGPGDDLAAEDPDPGFAEILDRRRRVRLEREEAAIAACVSEALRFTIIARIAAVLRTNQVFGLVDDLIFEIVTDPETRDNLRAKCAAARAPEANEPIDGATQTRTAATTPDFDLEVESGGGVVMLPDATAVSEIRTAHGSVIITGGAVTVEVAQSVDGGRSTIGSRDTGLQITPNNPKLAEITVPAGFFVTLSDTSISDPIEFAMFADGFE